MNKLYVFASLLITLVLLFIMAGVVCCNNDKTTGTLHTDSLNHTPYVFGISMKGLSKEDIINNLIENTAEFDYYNGSQKEIKQVKFCGVPFGLNLRTERREGMIIITSIILLTSYQDKEIFETIRSGISIRQGPPNMEETEGGDVEIDGRYFGKCSWNNGQILLRSLHGEKSGYYVFIAPTNN